MFRSHFQVPQPFSYGSMGLVLAAVLDGEPGQHFATFCNNKRIILQHFATAGSILQHFATLLQHLATILQPFAALGSILQQFGSESVVFS